MNARFETCCTCVEGRPAILSVDMGAGRDLVGLDVPNLLRVQYVLRQPDEDGLPDEEDERRIDELRAELTEWIGAAGGRYAGEISGGGQHSWFFYMACGWRAAAQLVHRIGLRLGVSLGAEMMPDARHRVYFEELLPTEEEWCLHETVRQLCALMNAGDDLAQPREVTHYTLFENRSQALAMVEWARREGFTVRLLHLDGIGTTTEVRAVDTAGRWLVEVVRHMAPAPKAMDDDARCVMRKAAHMGGIYCGWHAQAVRQAEPAT